MLPCLQTIAQLKILRGQMRRAQSTPAYSHTVKSLKQNIAQHAVAVSRELHADAHAQAREDPYDLEMTPLFC